MKTANERRRQWAANALACAAELPASADRDMLLQIAKEHLQAIERRESHKPPNGNSAAAKTGIR